MIPSQSHMYVSYVFQMRANPTTRKMNGTLSRHAMVEIGNPIPHRIQHNRDSEEKGRVMPYRQTIPFHNDPHPRTDFMMCCHPHRHGTTSHQQKISTHHKKQGRSQHRQQRITHQTSSSRMHNHGTHRRRTKNGHWICSPEQAVYAEPWKTWDTVSSVLTGIKNSKQTSMRTSGNGHIGNGMSHTTSKLWQHHPPVQNTRQR